MLVAAGRGESASTTSSPIKPTLTVYPRVFFAGSTVHLQCRITRDKDNRWVTFGFEDYRTSTEQLDGENSRAVFDVWLDHVPCEPGRAFCLVRSSQDVTSRVDVMVTVAGCGNVPDTP
jgi:hypothetical protein